MPLFDWLIALVCAALVLLAEYRVVIAGAPFTPFPLAASIALLIAVRAVCVCLAAKDTPVHITFAKPKKRKR